MTHLKYFLLTVVLAFRFSELAMAQNSTFFPTAKDRYKDVAGRYGGNSGICLFDDGKFVLYGYATMVFGSYGFEKDQVLFYPDKYDKFMVFATKNKSLGDSSRIYFQGFEEGPTFVKLGNESIQKVFNEGASCFNGPYVYTSSAVPSNITLFENTTEEWWSQKSEPNKWKFELDKGFNDLMLFYNEPTRERTDFSAIIELVDDNKVLKLSNYGGQEGYIKQVEEEDNNWQEILEYKRQYYQAKMHEDAIYANQHYNTFDVFENDNYRYDGATAMYVDELNKDNDSYYQSNPYGDSRFLRKYEKQLPKSKDSLDNSMNTIKSTVFYSACGDANSYEYEGIKLNKEEELQRGAEDLAAYSSVDTISANDYNSLKPFYIDREDGFYEVMEYNYTDISQSILAPKPILNKKDIEDIKMDFDERGTPIANISFTAHAARILEKFTNEHIEQPIAVVVNSKVVTMPVISEAIKGGKVSISGSYTMEEIEEIVKQLKMK